jgi:peptidyl-prolyl cis-trans isomerase B (cyclophilin B)
VSPTSRERKYAKRRYEKWRAKQVLRSERRRRQQRIGLAVAGAIAIVAVVALVATTLLGGDDDGVQTAAAASSSSMPSSSPSATGSDATPSGGSSTGSASSAGKTPTGVGNPCPEPTVKAPGSVKSWGRAPAADTSMGKTWSWTIETTCGPVLVELDGAKAPQAVASTIFLGQQGFYNSTPCHRLTTQGIFVLQCGDPTGKGTGGPGYSYGPVENAPKDNLYPAGTVAMARQGGNGSSMGSQFFLVYKDSTIPADSAGGYTVVGKIVGGLGTLEKVAAGGVVGGQPDGAPARAVSIVSTAVTPR